MEIMHVQDVTIEDNVVYGMPAGAQAVGLAAGPPAAVAFASPPMLVWRWPDGPEVESGSLLNIGTFRNTFLESGAVLAGIRQVCARSPPGHTMLVSLPPTSWCCDCDWS